MVNFSRKLVLVDGTVFFGNGFGSNEEIIREVVFQTAKTGYQDILQDSDNYNQIVVIAHPVVDNGRVPQCDYDISKGASALIVNKYYDVPLSSYSSKTFGDFLKDNNIPGLCDVDTNALIRKIRKDGVMHGIIVDVGVSDDIALIKLSAPHIPTHVKQISPKKSYKISVENKRFRIAFIAFTAKKRIINELIARACEVIVFPYNATAKEIEASQPDGVVLSNGPGDPMDLPELSPVIIALQEKYPLFGICLGHQLFAIANGAQTSKMKSGHRGEDVPVKDIATGRTLITFQNHGYHVDNDSLEGTNLEVTQYAIDDNSIEGLKHKKYPAFTAQYHPEAPEPRDANYLFDQFIEIIRTNKANVYKAL